MAQCICQLGESQLLPHDLLREHSLQVGAGIVNKMHIACSVHAVEQQQQQNTTRSFGMRIVVNKDESS
jgi:hypothetical protein